MTEARDPGLDVLRALALALVVLAHVIVVAELPWPAGVLGLDWGQLGVAGFCVMAGFFAVDGNKRLGEWAAERLVRLFPAYWLVTIVSFAGNALVGYKPATLGLFASQMLGTGYFSHGAINLIPAWFLTLMVTCYVAAAIVRVSRAPGLTLLALLVITVELVAVGYRADLTGQILVFLAGMTIRMVSLRQASRRARLAVGLLAPFLVLLSPRFGYTGWAIAAFLLFAAWRAPALAPVTFASEYLYELFLVHGPIVAAMHLSGMRGWLAVLVGVAAAVAAAVTLRWVTRRVTLLAFGSVPRPVTGGAGIVAALVALLPGLVL